MRKALLPMIASLALCGAATIALVATTARAEQSPPRPQMVALASPDADFETAAPPAEGGASDMAMPPREGLKNHCNDMVARETGQLAYLEAKLALTPAQAPLYARWKAVKLDLAGKHQSECATTIADRKPGAKPDLLDGIAMEEKLLKIRLADLEAERPSLTALYGALTPEQKAEFGRAARHKMEGRMQMMMGMMERRGPMMGHPPMGRGPDGPGMPPPPAH